MAKAPGRGFLTGAASCASLLIDSGDAMDFEGRQLCRPRSLHMLVDFSAAAQSQYTGTPTTFTVPRIFCSGANRCQADTASCRVAQSVKAPAPLFSVAG